MFNPKRKKIVLGLLWIASVANSQSFKHHQIGETPSEFLATESALKERLESCLSDKPRELTLDEIKRRYGKKRAEEMQHKEASLPTGSHLAVYVTDPDEYHDRCGAIIAALRDGSGEIWGSGYLPNNFYAQKRATSRTQALTGHPSYSQMMNLVKADTDFVQWRAPDPELRIFKFNNGHLDSFSFNMLVVTYESLCEDVTKRVGLKGTEEKHAYQNGYGASWNNLATTWNTDTIHVEVFHDANPTKQDPPRISIMSIANFKSSRDAENHRPSSLD